ncbi:MAG: hypothetical protein WCG21_01205 [Eubacteriales bacterium]
MATFATKDTNTTDIDPEALTVNLLGPEPDPDDLVIEPQNVKMPESKTDSDNSSLHDEADSDLKDYDSTDDDSEDDESIDKILRAQKPIQVSSDTDRDEAEIKAIEDMLNSKKSTRIKKQKMANHNESSAKGPRKHRIDPIVIVSGIVAAALIFVFAAYFLGLFDKTSNSLGMTLDEFSAAYAKTDAYNKVIASYGFAFPAVTLDQETAASDASGSAATSDVRTFTAYVDNTVSYQVALSGSVNKSDSNIKALQVVMLLSKSTAFNEVLVIYAPYIQVLYPEMTTKEATTFLSELYTSTDPVTVKGNYGLAMEKGTAGTKFYCSLNIISARDSKKYAADYTAASASASAAATSAATVPAATTAS